MLLSPMASGTYLWLRRRKARAHERSLHLQKEEENHRSQVEAQTKDFLRRRFIERQRLIDSVELHRAALQRNIYRAKRKNDYGRIVEDTTTDVIYEFTSSVDLDESLISVLEAEELIFEQLDIREEDDKQVGFDPSSIPFDGHSFERWVTEALVGYGWQAELTAAGRDQGIDVTASRNGKKVGLQCKLYSSSVGNKAIQEAHAGKVYYGLDAAAVITNSSYTSSARDLAAMTGVKLLSHHDIPVLYEKLFGR